MTFCTPVPLCPSLELAPCPPFFVVDIYQILVNVSLSVNLTETEYESIAKRCNIQKPTTTTTSTSSTTTTVRVTSSRETITPDTNPEVSSTPLSETGTTMHIPHSKEVTTLPLNTSSSNVISSSAKDITSTMESSLTTKKTVLTTADSSRRHRWPYCNDVCLIIVITSSVCAFLVLLVVLALCCGRQRPHCKTDSRSNSSQRLFANGTYERSSSLDRRSGIAWGHSSGVENLAYRKSMETREPLKYMEYEQNWEDLDYVAAGKDGSLRSNKSSQRSDNSPRRKRRGNKDTNRNSTEKLNQKPGMVFIPLEERKPRSLPKLPIETQHYSDKADYFYTNGLRFSSLPRTPKQSNVAEHRRSKSDGQNRPRSKQRPRSFEQLSCHSHNIDRQEKHNLTEHLYSEPNQIKNNLKSKDTNLRQVQNRKQNNTSRQHLKNENPSSVSSVQNPTTSSRRGVDRSFEHVTRENEHVFPTVHASSSPKFYPPYRDPNKDNLIFTTKL